MSKYLKKVIVFALIILFCSFIVDTIEITSEKDLAVDIIVVDIKKEVPKIALYPKDKTQKVSHKLDSLLKRINKRHDFHGSILVAHKGKILFSNEYGYANFKKKIPIDDKSVFQLASVSKQFTATAILILNEKKHLSLSDSVTKYFPNFPYADVTIKHLLNHTGGLPKYFWIAENKWKSEKAPSNFEMMQLMADSDVSRFFMPGRNFDYSNTGYFVLASIIEKISGMNYGQFLKINIFDPLDMNNSFVYSFENDDMKSDQLHGYRLYRGWRHIKIKGTVNDAIVGDKNVYSTSEDLYKWMIGLNSQKIISKESLQLMYTKGKTKSGRKVPYGLGFRIGTKNDEKVIYHYGKWNGFSTSISQYIDSDLLIIVLEHSSYSSMNYLNKAIKNIVDINFDYKTSKQFITSSNQKAP